MTVERRPAGHDRTAPDPGSHPAGSDAAGNQAAGSHLGGSDAAGNQAAGSHLGDSDAAGNQAAGSHLGGSDAAGNRLGSSDPAGSDAAVSQAAGSATREQFDRTLALLWRDRTGGEPAEPARGRRPTLTIGRIVAAAVAVADADGLAATSMHRVARELGAGTMTLYTYVPGKVELVDLMVDEVLVERQLPAPGEPRTGDWRAQVKLYAERTRAAYRRHPWLRETSWVRPVLGPGQFAGQEYLLSIMDGLGLPAREVAAAANSVAGYIDANAAVEAESHYLESSTGQSNDAWWGQRYSFWETYFDAGSHPAMNRTWLAGGFDRPTAEQAADACEFGLDRLLDGIGDRAARRSS
ncbi:hypothetical protein GCM10022222_69350 [Amycolatopsis ultiminotia]|uniref:HTH tetR-type domain-containing protein n=1 Tax=Amycolatopsis ultiminotia TaxID=543629 RepID=A0ABP6Y0B1_9PSEU